MKKEDFSKRILRSRGSHESPEFTWRAGQSLIEVLVGIVIGAVMVGAVAAIISPVLQLDTQTTRAQVASALGKELMDNVTVWAEANWHNIDTLATSSLYTYYLSTSTPTFTSSTGIEAVTVGSTTYGRYFFLEDVWREADCAFNPDDTCIIVESSTSTNGLPVNSVAIDPSMRKVTVVYIWPPASSTNSIVGYLARSKNNFYLQTNWAGGSGFSGPTTNIVDRFSASVNVNVTTSTGSIILNGF